jgi:predicted dehydrogenase
MPKPAALPRLALVGCGAIAERFHLVALRRLPEVARVASFVDPDLDRARRLAAECPGARAARDVAEILGEVDGAIVTVPAHLHLAVALPLLRAGIPVLCEKPLAPTAADARAMVAAAREAGVALAVNNTRRYFPAYREVARLLASGVLGSVRRLTYADGDRFDWPSATGALFGRASGGRGVLMDIGAHVIDLVCWWSGAAPEVTAYADDAMGGSEAVAHVSLAAGSAVADVRLSWLSKLANAYRVECEGGTIEGTIYDWRAFTLRQAGRRARQVTVGTGARVFGDFAHEVLADFLGVLRDGGEAAVSGAAVLPSLDVIDACYARRDRFAMPWFDAARRVVA